MPMIPGGGSASASRQIVREVKGITRPIVPGAISPAENLKNLAEARGTALNRVLSKMGVALRFRVGGNINDLRIMIVDSSTGQVIRMIPPEYFMRRVDAFNMSGSSTGLAWDVDV